MHFKLFIGTTIFSILAFVFAYFILIVPAVFNSRVPLTANEMKKTTVPSHSTDPLISNQWYSTIYKSFPTDPMYALPLAYRISEKGIEVSYPSIQKTADEIVAPFVSDLYISTNQTILNTKITSVGDWHITTLLNDVKGKQLTATFGHGLPYVTVKSNANVQINTYAKFNVSSNNVPLNTPTITDTILLEGQDRTYIILLPKATTVSYIDSTLTFSDTKNVLVGILDNNSNVDAFKDIRNLTIIDTQTYPTVQGEEMRVQYDVSGQNGITPLIALYPHQYDNLQDNIDPIGTYRSIRGPLYLYKMSSFTTNTELIVPQNSYSPLTSNAEALKIQIQKDTEEIIKNGPPSDKVYTLGTWFGKVGTLILLADSHGMQKERQMLVKYIEPRFTQSLTQFKYDKNKTSVIATNSEFGNDELNDHHFHYGYYIRLAAILGSYNLSYADQVQGSINQMVNDIATTNRQDTKYPFLRNFDAYESHSWADGYGNATLGNNQESSSEAINAWYSLYLWSQVTQNTNLKQYALYLYNAEIIGAKYYWFDIKGIYGPQYKHAIASQVWGGKVSFSTWFSGETNMKYGIQLLPLTPGSEYLGTFEDFARYENDYTNSNGSVDEDWGDLFVAWKSFYSSEEAVQQSAMITKMEGNNTRSNLLYYLYKNSE